MDGYLHDKEVQEPLKNKIPKRQLQTTLMSKSQTLQETTMDA